MAELPELIKVSSQVKTALEEKKGIEGHSSIDSVIRNTLQENEKLKIENELLRKKLDECENTEE